MKLLFILLLSTFTLSASKQTGLENFQQFFQKFTTDHSFQLKRVKFPLKCEALEIGEEVPSISFLKKIDWEFIDFKYDKSYAIRRYDAYTQKIVFKGKTTVIIERRGNDNGIYIDYNFKLENGKWYFVSIKDSST